MGTHDARVDAYIARAADFAQPILSHLRELVHAACPGTNETIKWGFPHFEYEGLLCSMAAFKGHCAFGFWHADMRALEKAAAADRTAMGQFGRITRLSDLPTDAALKALIKQGAALNEQGIKATRTAKAAPTAPPVAPDYLVAALKRSKGALTNFKAMSPSHQREYIEWLVDAKRDETRAKRLATAVEWIGEGKSKEWKYRGN